MLSGMCTRRHTPGSSPLATPLLQTFNPQAYLSIRHWYSTLRTQGQIFKWLSWSPEKPGKAASPTPYFTSVINILRECQTADPFPNPFLLLAHLKIKNHKVILDSCPPPRECNKKELKYGARSPRSAVVRKQWPKRKRALQSLEWGENWGVTRRGPWKVQNKQAKCSEG